MSRSLLGSSLSADAVSHAAGAHVGRSIPRGQGAPEQGGPPAVPPPTRWPVPESIRRERFEQKRGIYTGALSPGDFFTTRLTFRHGWVVAKVRGLITGAVLVEWTDTKERVELPESIKVVAGWWEVSP